MRRARCVVACALVALAALALDAGPAAAHATLVRAFPAGGGRVKVGPATAVLVFSEPVAVVNRTDVSVVDGDGVRIDAGTTHTAPGDPRRVVIPLRGPMVPDSYTVRYRIVSDDSHSEFGAFAFAVGDARLGAPILAGSGGLSDTSPAAVGARVVEFAAMLGLLGFRALVWGPAVEGARGLPRAGREQASRDGQRSFWRALWALTVAAGAAETAVLAAKSAVVFHTGPIGAAKDPADAYRLVAASRFGDVLGWRCGALALLAGVAFATWNAESARAPSAGSRAPMALMGGLALAELILLADQGHASQAPLAPFSVAIDAAHLAAVGLWTGGLVCLAVVVLRAPRAIPDGGRELASAALSRFSRVASWCVVVIAVTGTARAIGELSGPAQLLSTGYGRDLMLKTALLAPILAVAVRNRRLVATLDRGRTPTVGALRGVARSVQAELAIAMAIVVVAAVLVAQIPGRA